MAEIILASGHARPHRMAAHMEASYPLEFICKNACNLEPSTYGPLLGDRPFGGNSPPIVAYRFEDSRATDSVARHLSGYRGILQVDGYGAYSKLVRKDGGNDGVILAGCWAHSRRKFYELHVAKSSKVATETLGWHAQESRRYRQWP